MKKLNKIQTTSINGAGYRWN